MNDIKKLAEDQAVLANQGPAVFSNRFYITVGPVVRIAFAEQVSGSDQEEFRNAVVLSHSDAIELADLLKSLLAGIELQLAEAKRTAAEKGNG